MSYSLNKKLADLKPYDPIQGSFKIRLDANESFIDINKDLQNELVSVLAEIPLNRYPDPFASAPVKAFSELYNIPEKYITAGNGSDELISIITSCFLETGDKILTLAPDFSMYAFYGSLYELNVETMEKEPDLTINVDKVIRYCQKNNIKALIFSNPCNPTSLGLKKADVIRLIENIDGLIILDEAYMDFWTESLLDIVGEYDNLIILKTCSKAIGMAALRLGFVVANEVITTALRAAKSPYNTDSISQAIGAFVLSQKETLADNCRQLVELRTELYNEIKTLSEKYPVLGTVYPTVTNFVFIKTSAAEKIFLELMNRSIAIRKFNGYLRITAGSKDENKQLISELTDILKNI